MIIHNGTLADDGEAAFNLADTDATYGYGCYETLKVRDGFLYFPEFHAERLSTSARILGLQHDFTASDIVDSLHTLLRASSLNDCNLKIMVIGHDNRPADWYIFALPALYPPAGSALSGVPCLYFHGERHFPQAKSLSMLLSTVAFRKAAAQGCYDALLVNRRDEITEGTRTNVFFAIKGGDGIIYTPPQRDVLSGITRKTFIEAMETRGVAVRERPLPLHDALSGTIGMMVSSTSTRLVPINRLLGSDDGIVVDVPILSLLTDAADAYASWLDAYRTGKKCSHT